MSDVTLNLTPAVYQYLLHVSLREPMVLKKLRERTHLLPNAVMQISPEQGQFMTLLIELITAKKTLDIGTFTGYSALVVALSLPDDGKVITCDVDKDSTSIAQQFWKEAQVENKIDLHLKPAIETLDELLALHEQGTFDFAFIDADKENYPLYYEKSLALMRQGGLIAIDNTLWGGLTADPYHNEPTTQKIREFNEMLHQDDRVTLSLIPIGDGLTLARKR